MTTIEFNKKYLEYLGKDHYGLSIGEDEVINFLDTFFTGLVEKEVDFEYYQIKMKFGAARVYTSLEPEVNAALERAINVLAKDKENDEEE